MVSRKNTGRVDSSQIKSFLCFTCGDVYNISVDYHRHIMEHQAVSLIYQLYYLEHEYQTNPDLKNQPENAESSPLTQSASSKRYTEPVKRLSGDASRRQIRYSDDNEEIKRKNSRQRMAIETVKTAEKSVRRASFKDVGSPTPKKPRINLDHIPERLRFTDCDGYLEMKTHEMFCDLCPNNPSFTYPLDALSHWVKDHDAEIIKNEIQFFARGTKLTHTTKAAGEECPTCSIRFGSSAEGHLHIFEKHLAEIIEVLIAKLNVPSPIDELIINSTVQLPFQKESIIRINANVVLK